MTKVLIKRLSNLVPMPKYETLGSSGMDIAAFLTKNIEIKPGKTEIIPTGFSLSIPKGFEIQIRPRSGLAAKKGIDVFAGVIDSGYRGEIKVCLYNSSGINFEINKGDRIAQIIFHKLPQTEMLEVGSLEDSIRGDEGFGSSGV